MSTIAHNQVLVTGGVDTHKDTHTAAAVDAAGRMLGSAQFPATPAGYAALLGWLGSHGQLVLVGVEGTGVYGAGLARFLHTHGVPVVEVDRPDRKTRRWQGKSDPVDAEAAARAALAAKATGTPKHRTGQVEALRNLRVARRCAVCHRADIQRRLHALVITAPEPLRGRLHPLPAAKLVAACAALRPDPARAGEPDTAAKLALRQLAPPPPAAHHRDHQTRRADRPAGRRDQPHPARRTRHRPRRGRATTGHCRRQPPPSPLRGRLRHALRRRPTAGLIRQDQPAPAQPRR
jgi:transposase